MTTEQITITGTHCEACGKTITRALAKEGVTVQGIDVKTGKATITYDGVTRARISRVLKAKGYALAGKEASTPLVPRPYAVEGSILRAGAITLFLLLIIQAVILRFFAPTFAEWSPKYFVPLLLMPIAVVTNAITLWHQRAYEREVSCMTGMMVGMTIGMTTGLLVGAIAGLINGMFFGSLIGLIAGMAIGAYAGNCCGTMGLMEGLTAGLMGGTMGAMLTVMMVIDHPVAFLLILTGALAIILAGLMRIVYQEHADSGCSIRPWSFPLVFGACLLVDILITLAIVLLPKGIY